MYDDKKTSIQRNKQRGCLVLACFPVKFIKHVYIERKELMSIITNIYTYVYNTLLLLSDDKIKKEFAENVTQNLNILSEDLPAKKYASKLQTKIISNLNTLLKNNTLSRKEKAYLRDLRNYLMQVRRVLLEQEDLNPINFLNNNTNVELKNLLSTISEKSGIIKGKIKLVTGDIIEVERRRKKDNLNFFDKNYVFNYTIKKK